MLTLVITLLTVILVFICILMGILILMQLPKKDAGAGLAFGGGTAEAIFGAGAGTPLAQITKYCAGIFLCLALVLSALNAQRSNEPTRLIEEEAALVEGITPDTSQEPGIPDTSETITQNPEEEELKPAETTKTNESETTPSAELEETSTEDENIEATTPDPESTTESSTTDEATTEEASETETESDVSP